MAPSKAQEQRAALAAQFSSAPDASRPVSADAEVVEIRSVRSTLDLPAATHHALGELLRDEAFILGASPKWVGVQAGLLAAVQLVLTDETVAQRWRSQLAANERARQVDLRAAR